MYCYVIIIVCSDSQSSQLDRSIGGVCIETSQTKSPEGILSVFRVLSMLTLNVNV